MFCSSEIVVLESYGLVVLGYEFVEFKFLG